MFDHFLITRFNLVTTFWKTNKNNEEVLTPEWLDHRYELFLNFCLPSIKQQSSQNFKWLVFFDTGTPEKYRALNEKISNGFTPFVPIYLESMEMFMGAIKTQIDLLSTPENHHVITTRLDNDDALHRDYVRTIQDNFEPKNRLVLDPVNGHILKTEPEVYLSTKVYPGNPFISLIELKDSATSAYSRHHTKWATDSEIKTIDQGHLWLQNIHEKNMVMKFSSKALVNDFSVLTQYGMSKDYISRLPKRSSVFLMFANLMFFLRIKISLLKRAFKSIFKKPT